MYFFSSSNRLLLVSSIRVLISISSKTNCFLYFLCWVRNPDTTNSISSFYLSVCSWMEYVFIFSLTFWHTHIHNRRSFSQSLLLGNVFLLLCLLYSLILYMYIILCWNISDLLLSSDFTYYVICEYLIYVVIINLN